MLGSANRRLAGRKPSSEAAITSSLTSMTPTSCTLRASASAVSAGQPQPCCSEQRDPAERRSYGRPSTKVHGYHCQPRQTAREEPELAIQPAVEATADYVSL